MDNLWKCLQDILEDPVVNMAHIVINNIHCMESTDSTTALLTRLCEDAVALQTRSLADRRTKWLLSSRNEKQIRDSFKVEHIFMVDLEDKEYGGQRTQARKNHVRDAVQQLKARKTWSGDLAYTTRNFLVNEGQDEQWVEVLCLLLDAKPSTTSDLSIEKWLREVGKLNLYRLIGQAWEEVGVLDRGR